MTHLPDGLKPRPTPRWIAWLILSIPAGGAVGFFAGGVAVAGRGRPGPALFLFGAALMFGWFAWGARPGRTPTGDDDRWMNRLIWMFDRLHLYWFVPPEYRTGPGRRPRWDHLARRVWLLAADGEIRFVERIGEGRTGDVSVFRLTGGAETNDFATLSAAKAAAERELAD